MSLHLARTVRRDARGQAADSVTLDYEGRFLRRRLLTTDTGAALHVDLPETISLADGDAFETVDGRLIAVRAAPEPLAARSAMPAVITPIAAASGPARLSPASLRASHVTPTM